MILASNDVTLIGDGLDHPEGVCIGPDGTVHACGEAGQVYHIDTDGTQKEIGSTGSFLLEQHIVVRNIKL